MATAVARSAVRYGSRVDARRADPLTLARRARVVYFVLGWVFFGLGILGILLPIMPGVVFMILALWAFSRSSRRFHDWLYYHRYFGPPLQRWHRYRVVPWKARIIAYGSMLGGVALSGLVLRAHPAVPITMAVVSIAAIVYISRCPSEIPDTLDGMGLASRRFSGLVVEDLDQPGTFRTLELIADGLPVRDGDLAAVLDDVRNGMLFRYVVFPASGELEDLAGAYLAGFGALAAPLCLSRAVLLDAAANQLISLSTWRDAGALQEFLEHSDFEAARARIGPHVAGPPESESLRVCRLTSSA